MRKRHLTDGREMPARERAIARAGVVGIVANLALAVMKAAVGTLAGSVSVTLDAVNNLTDAISSVTTVAGAAMAAKDADYEHPMGHGRIEYVAALAVAVLVAYAGAKSVAEAIRSLVSPSPAHHDLLTVALIATGILAKVALCAYFGRKGAELNSPVLVATGKDARSDVALSSGTLASAVASMAWGVSVEGVVGLVIALAVLWSGIKMVREVVDDLVGGRAGRDETEAVMASMAGFEEVTGVYDLVIHSYGPESHVASARLGVAPSMTLKEFALLERRVAEHVHAETGVRVEVLGVCYDEGAAAGSERDGDGMDAVARSAHEVAESHDGVLQSHGFVIDEERGQARIDIVVGFDEDDPDGIADSVAEGISEVVGYDDIRVTVDRNVTDL